MHTVAATGALKLSWLLLAFPLFGAVVLLDLLSILDLSWAGISYASAKIGRAQPTLQL